MYQDEKKESSTKRSIYTFGLEPKQKKLTKRWCTFLLQHCEYKKKPTEFLNQHWV